MEELFATKIIINDVLNIKGFEIALSETERRHLIITGKNGSGKTTALRYIRNYLFNAINNRYDQTKQSIKSLSETIRSSSTHPSISDLDIENWKKGLESSKKWLIDNEKAVINFNKGQLEISKAFIEGTFIISFFEAKLNNQLIAPTGIKKIDFKQSYSIDERASVNFIQYIVNLKADKSFANDDKDFDGVKKIDEWFNNFQERFLQLFAPDAELQFDRKTYNFNILEPNKLPYNFNQLSDGYSAILDVLTELIMRMEEHGTKNYDIQGIVLIDEIETHLHIDLQKKILPFLIAFFPKIQFIVTTHSPFVITSIENAVICDLEKKVVFDKLSGALEGWSVDEIIKDILGVKESRNEYYLELLENFNRSLDRENFEEAQRIYEHLDKILHPESSLKKVLKIQLTGLSQND